MTSNRTYTDLAMVAFVLSLLGVGACGLALNTPTNRCEEDAECRSGVCNVELGMCVSIPRDTLNVALEVVPTMDPFGVEGVAVTFPPQELTETATRDLTLPVTVPSSGRVWDATSGEDVSAELTFRVQSEIPGHTAGAISAETIDTRTENDFTYNLVTRVLPGRVYSVEVQPTGEWRSTLPPMRLERRWMSPDDAAIARLPAELLTYPPVCSAGQLTMPTELTEPCLVVIKGHIVDAQDAPQNELVIRAVDINGRVVSSTYTTGRDADAPAGYFELTMNVAVWSDQESWGFRINPTSERMAQGPSPTFSVEPRSLYEEAGLVTILMPTVASTIQYEGTIESALTTAPLENASVTFRSDDVVDSTTGVVGHYEATATSDASGHFALELLPGHYDTVVRPDAVTDGGLRVFRDRRDLTVATGALRGQLFQIPERTRFGGTIQTVDGQRMIDTQIRALVRSSDRPQSASTPAMFARPNETVSDPNGLFELRLDVGLYDVVIQPPAQSNYPWRVVRDVEIGGADAPWTNVFELDNPVTLTGTASFDVNGDPVAVSRGRVRAYAVVNETSGPRAVLIGETTTDDAGRYTLLLPPSL